MENLKEQFKERLLSTKRDGMETVIKHLDRLGFFVAPASTKFHLNVKGGLMQHSWNVCNTALMLREQMIAMNPDLAGKLPEESVVLASLLHVHYCSVIGIFIVLDFRKIVRGTVTFLCSFLYFN